MNFAAPAPIGTATEPARSRRHTGFIALTSAVPVGLTTALTTGSPVASALVAAGTATCVMVAGLMI